VADPDGYKVELIALSSRSQPSSEVA